MEDFYGLSKQFYIDNVVRKHKINTDFYIEKSSWEDYIDNVLLNENLNSLLKRYHTGANEMALEEDNIFRINRLNTIEYLTFISLLYKENRKVNFRELREVFNIAFKEDKIIDLKLRKGKPDFLKKDKQVILKQNNLVYVIAGLNKILMELNKENSIFNIKLPKSKITYKGEIIPVAWKIFFEVREILEYISQFFIPKIPLKKIESLNLLHHLFLDFIDDERDEQENIEISHIFVEDVFAPYYPKPQKRNIKKYINKIKDIESFTLLFVFLFKRGFFDIEKTTVFVYTLKRLFSPFRKGFSERNIYKCIELLSLDDTFEIPNYKSVNKRLKLLQ